MRLLDVPIKLDASFFVMAFMLSYGRISAPVLLAEWLIVVTISILLHEFGHALIGRRFGLEPTITLHSFGGLTSWSAWQPLTPLQELVISLAGPMAGFLFGALVFLANPIFLASNSIVLEQAYQDFLWVNIGWGIFNLLPMLPLDGGNACAAIERHLTAKPEAAVTSVVSFIVAAVVLILALANHSTWIALLSGWFAVNNGNSLWQKWQRSREQPLAKIAEEASAAINRQDLAQAERLITQLRQEAHTDATKCKADYLSVFLNLQKRDFDRAKHILSNYEALYGKEIYLRGLLHYYQEEWAESIPYLQELFAKNPIEWTGSLLYNSLVEIFKFAEARDLCSHPALAKKIEEFHVHLQTKAFYGGDYDTSAAVGKTAFVYENNPDVAYNIACALGRQGKIVEGLEWLKKAIECGFNSLDSLNTDEDLDPFRGTTEFTEIIKTVQRYSNDDFP